MKNRFTLLIAVLIVAVLLAYMFFFQVRYDQVAVLTTFSKAEPPKRADDGTLARAPDGSLESPGSVKDKPGLYFRLPWPIQEVTTYPTRVQLLDDDTLEQVQTKDGISVVVKTYLVWRIADPHAFFVALKDQSEAQKLLAKRLSDAKSVFGKYDFDQIVNADPAKARLSELEDEALAEVRAKLTQLNQNYGIEVVELGVRRIVLAEKVTEKVFGRMRDARNRLAEDARSGGKARAASIVSEAQSAQGRILAFAQARATKIEAQGQAEAAKYYGTFAQDQELAVFLEQTRALREMLQKNTTFVLDAGRISPLNLFLNEPGSTAGAPPRADAE